MMREKYHEEKAEREVNRQLKARRALMQKRIRRGRIVLTVFALFALAEVILQLCSNIRLPLSCTLADLLAVYGIYSLLAFVASFLPIVYLFATVIAFRSERLELLRKSLPIFLWVDLILTLALGGQPYGIEGYWVKEMILNLLLHIPVIWLVQRAVRAVASLEILPDEEMEGDPYEGLGSHGEDE